MTTPEVKAKEIVSSIWKEETYSDEDALIKLIAQAIQKARMDGAEEERPKAFASGYDSGFKNGLEESAKIAKTVRRSQGRNIDRFSQLIIARLIREAEIRSAGK